MATAEAAEAARAELERRARALSEWCDRYGHEAHWSDGMKARNRALAELLHASTSRRRGSMPCVYCHGTGAECTRCEGTGTQPESKEGGEHG